MIYQRQTGLTLIELMLGMTLSLFMLLGLTFLLLGGKASYRLQDQQAQVQETGRYAIDVLTRAIRQAGYVNWNDWHAPILLSEDAEPNVMGLDARTLKKNTPAMEAMTAGVVNGSDVLAIRFFGADPDVDGALLNCAGFSVAAPVAEADADEQRSWSIFFVARDASGEPELRCKYRTQSGWNADAIARGVESFQVLYGVDVHGNGAVQFMSAEEVNKLDAADGAMPQMHWKKVSAIRIGLLVSGAQKIHTDELIKQHDLFGAAYSDLHGGQDTGVRIVDSALPVASRNRVRSVFTQTIRLRNTSQRSGI